MNSPITKRRGLRSQGKEVDSKIYPSMYPSLENDDDKDNEEKVKNREDSGCDDVKDDRRMHAYIAESSRPGVKLFVKEQTTGPAKKKNVGLPVKPKRQSTQKSKKVDPFLPHWCLLCILAAAVVLAYMYNTYAHSQPVATPKEKLDSFLSKLEELKKQFPNQSERFWSVIASAPMSHLKPFNADDVPDRPVVVLLAGQPGTSATTACIANQLGQLYTIGLGGPLHRVEPVIVNGSDFLNVNHDLTKRDIDNKFTNGFDQKSKAAIVHQFDKLPSCSALLFHSYCENDNAQYTDVAIILTLELDSHVYRIRNEADRLVNEHLAKRWSSCPEFEERGKIGAMLSRVANNIALVATEQDSEHC